MKTKIALALLATLAISYGTVSGDTVLIDPTTNDGSFENAPGADNIGSVSWNDIGSQSFWSLNRSLGPNGNPDPQEGAFSGVANPGGRAAIESDPISIDLVNGSVFMVTGYFGTNQSGGVTSDYSIGLRFNDVSMTQLDLGDATNIGADGALFTNSGVASNITGLIRNQLTAPPVPNRWVQFGHEATYTGGPATSVTLVFEARTGGGQTYWDNFNLVQVMPIPEPNTAFFVAILGGCTAIRRKR